MDLWDEGIVNVSKIKTYIATHSDMYKLCKAILDVDFLEIRRGGILNKHLNSNPCPGNRTKQYACCDRADKQNTKYKIFNFLLRNISLVQASETASFTDTGRRAVKIHQRTFSIP